MVTSIRFPRKPNRAQDSFPGLQMQGGDTRQGYGSVLFLSVVATVCYESLDFILKLLDSAYVNHALI